MRGGGGAWPHVGTDFPKLIKLTFLPFTAILVCAFFFALEKRKAGTISVLIHRETKVVASSIQFGLDGVDSFLRLTDANAKEVNITIFE